MFVMPINAQTPAEFGYQLHPEKLLENTVGTLQIFVTSNEMMVPRSINDLKVISSDNSVIQIIDIQENKAESILGLCIQYGRNSAGCGRITASCNS